MSFAEFKASLQRNAPPAGLGPALTALWHEGRGEWAAAHRRVQDEPAADAAWVHAYLHRKEGDAGNAAHWYARAERPVCATALADEWSDLVRTLLRAE